MRKTNNKKRRVRMTQEDVKKKSTSADSGRGNWFKLPDGVSQWEPDKPGKYKIDILPYETTSEHHPNDVEAGVVWYQYPFKVHHSVGPAKKSIVCPTSIGQRCPICEEVQRLSKDYEENKEMIGELRPQKYVAFNMINPDDKDKVSIFSMSFGKFAKHLMEEINESEEEGIANFFDIDENGRTLQVRFSKQTYAGRDYLEASKIDFHSRKPMDEEEVFGKVVNLDEMFIVPSYEKIAEMFNASEEDAEEDEETPATKKGKRAPKPPVDEDEEDDDEEEAPAPKKGKGKKAPPVEEDEDDDDDWDDDEEEEEAPAPKKGKKAPPPVEEDEDDEDDWDDDEDDEEEEEEKPAPKKKIVKRR